MLISTVIQLRLYIHSKKLMIEGRKWIFKGILYIRSLCVNMFIKICVYIHTYIYTCIHTHTHTHTHICKNFCILQVCICCLVPNRIFAFWSYFLLSNNSLLLISVVHSEITVYKWLFLVRHLSLHESNI